MPRKRSRALLAITPEVGQLLYALTLAARPTLIIDLGASLGSSTIYLACALRDLGAGSIITTELLSEKAQQASSNLAAAGLGDLVDIRVGDASSRSPILTSESTFCSSTAQTTSTCRYSNLWSYASHHGRW